MNLIKITENDIRTLIKECVCKILKEDIDDELDDVSDLEGINPETGEEASLSNEAIFEKTAMKIKWLIQKKLLNHNLRESYGVDWINIPGQQGFRKINDTRFICTLSRPKTNAAEDEKFKTVFKTNFDNFVKNPILSSTKDRKTGESMTKFGQDSATGECPIFRDAVPGDNSGKNMYIKIIIIDALAEKR